MNSNKKRDASDYFKSLKPTAIRRASELFLKRDDNIRCVNGSIGNISLPVHYEMWNGLAELVNGDRSVLRRVYEVVFGRVPKPIKYSGTVGIDEAREGILNIIAATTTCNTKDLYAHVTAGGSEAMILMMLGCCGNPGEDKYPLLVFDPTYTNYMELAEQIGRKVVSVRRKLSDDGIFTIPSEEEIDTAMEQHNPGAALVIIEDNPTAHSYTKKEMTTIGKLCVKHGIKMVSDEAYRGMNISNGGRSASVWNLTDDDVPGIVGNRASIESGSKWGNLCGGRIGALVTDSKSFHDSGVAAHSPSLCSNVIAQHALAAMANLDHHEIQGWFRALGLYYHLLKNNVTQELKRETPGLIVSKPGGAPYSTLDTRNINWLKPSFNAEDFVNFCAQYGSVLIDGEPTTLLLSPMADFYNVDPGEENPGRTQARLAYAAPPEDLYLVPKLFYPLLRQFNDQL